MGQTLEHGIFLPDEGERNCYSGLAENWVALDTLVGAYSSHYQNTTIHVTSADKQAWNGKADASALTAHTGDTTIHVTAEDKAKWDAVTGKANDADVVHKSGDETIRDTKTFGNGTLIVNNAMGSNVHGEIKLNGSRLGYIVADNSNDGVFNNNNCGVSILLQDENKPLHIAGYKADSNGRVFADTANKKPVLSLTSSLIKTATLVPENDTVNSAFRILSQLDYANGNPSKTLDVRFIQYDDASGSSAIYSNDDGKTSLGVATRKWSDVRTYKVNGVEPSSLSLPSGNASDVIDISSYITNLNGASNSYTVPANGWISIAVVGTAISIASSSWSDSRLRESSGNVRMLYPVLKNETVSISVTGTTLDYARFIPCQGNV